MTDLDLDAIGTHPAPITHTPCCSTHGIPMTCERYRHTHFVEVRPCCAADQMVLDRDALVAEVRSLREAVDGYADTVDLWDAAVTSLDAARVAIARVRALCDQVAANPLRQPGTLALVDADAVLAALDVGHDPIASDDYYVIEVDPETGRISVTYPSATTDGRA